MEKQDFMPRPANSADERFCDLPPVNLPITPPIEREGGCGCQKTDTCLGHEGCSEGSWGLCDHPLAIVYAPCQYFRALYDPVTALNRGTMFTELDLPFGGDGCFTAAPEGCACRLDRAERSLS